MGLTHLMALPVLNIAHHQFIIFFRNKNEINRLSPASGQPIKKRLRSSTVEKEKSDSSGEGPSPPPPPPAPAASSSQAKSPSRSKKQLRRSQRQRNPSGGAAACTSNAASTGASSVAAGGGGGGHVELGESEEMSSAMRVGTRHMAHKEWDETNVDCYCPNREVECFKVSSAGGIFPRREVPQFHEFHVLL